MTPRRFFLLLVAALAATLFAAGCGGGENGEPVATTEVTMAKSYRFDPKTIEVEAGRTVTWTNDDNFTHTVQVDGQEDHEVDQGENVSIKFDTPGTYLDAAGGHQPDHGFAGYEGDRWPAASEPG
jgi:plastocyanin